MNIEKFVAKFILLPIIVAVWVIGWSLYYFGEKKDKSIKRYASEALEVKQNAEKKE